ncbi:hypothetical protein TKK_0010114 [Trichogramma kaykai]|uniref:E3 ubiquitin-protein ligase listerin n=1 Tax=Trichogramma kaykai TaxID=54128 RepID=A0ABD2WYA9_9HYME
MGKNKGQRTKNNAQPSSSSRSAEFLGVTPGFIGYTAAKDGGYVPLMPGLSLDQPDLSNIEPNFQMVFKKMNKKDSTTKYKAIQEFAILCKDLELADIENVLPFWPRIYSQLSLDIDHRVREAVQVSHTTLVQRVGRTIATYLKQLAGPWFVAQYDTYPPAASAATNGFNNTFPPPKFVSAIAHCQVEILTYISDNLIILSPQSLSTNKSVPPEEKEAKYERLLCSSLQAYSFYLKTVGNDNVEKTIDFHKNLISNNKFWKLAKHDVLPIKTGFFNVLNSLICHANHIVIEERKKILTSVFNSLDESDPNLLIAVWETLLVAINNIEDWHKVISIEKLVLPKLWSILKNGGSTCASVVYPSLLPFLSHFTKCEIDKENMYTNFFENMRLGFSVKSVKFSRSETFAVVTSFVECFKYAILVNCMDTKTCKNLLIQQLTPVIRNCIYECTPFRSPFFCELSHLVRYWSKNKHNSDYPAYNELMNTFWSELMNIFDQLVDSADTDYNTTVSDIIESIADLLNYLQIAPSHNRRNMKVKFSDTMNAPTSEKIQQSPAIICHNQDVEFSNDLQQLVTKLCVDYFKRINENPSKHKIINLIKIIHGHENEKLFVALSKSYDTDENLLQFYNQYLKPLMSLENEETNATIDFIFIIISYMDNIEKIQTLKSFTEVNNQRVLKSILKCAISEQYREDINIQNWLRQERIASALVSASTSISSSMSFSETDEKLLKCAFKPLINGDLIVSGKVISEIVSKLCLTLTQVSRNHEKEVARTSKLLSDLLYLSWTHRDINPYSIQLLKALFHLNIREVIERTDEEEMSSVLEIAQKTWTEGLLELSNKIPQDEFIEHVKYFSSTIWKIIDFSDEVLKDSIVELSSIFVEIIIKCGEKYSTNFITTFLTELEIKMWVQCATKLICYGEVLSGKLHSSNLLIKGLIWENSYIIDLHENQLEDTTHKCLKWAVIIIKILNNLLAKNLDIPELSDLLINLSYVAALGENHNKHYSCTMNANIVHQLLNELYKELEELKNTLPEDVHIEFFVAVKQLIIKYGGFYPNILKFYHEYLYSKNDLSMLFENEKFNDVNTLLQSTQVLKDCEILYEYLLSCYDESDFQTFFIANHQMETNQVCDSLNRSFDTLSKLQNKPSVLLLNRSITVNAWEKYILPLECINFLTKCVTIIPTQLNTIQWDKVLLCLSTWSDSLGSTIKNLHNFEVKAFVIAVSKLYTAIQALMNKQEKHPVNLPPKLLDEWKNVFASELQESFFEYWIEFAELYNLEDSVMDNILPLKYLGKTLQNFRENIFELKTSRIKRFSQDEILNLSTKLISSPIMNLQLGTFITLSNIAKTFVACDKKLIEEEDFNTSSLNICKLKNVLNSLQAIVDTMLMEFKLGDSQSFVIQPYTDSYTYTVGYLFTWGTILTMCAEANADLRYHYADVLRDGFFSSLLSNLFRLMPSEILHDKNKSVRITELFTKMPSLDFEENWSEWRLDHWVCWLYTNCLRYLPVIVRQWWSTVDSRTSSVVDKVTTSYVSPILCNEEFRDKRFSDLSNMQIKVHPSVREVVALYNIDDESKLELIIKLPSNYPLGTVDVEPGQYSGPTKWRNCHLQLSIFLTHQNGSIFEGLKIWKANIDKRYSGVEECCICFSVFQINTYQLPHLTCSTCRKKFHKQCLYKWFSTSQKSTCPICRNTF